MMMNNMNNVAFGAGKSGVGFDPVAYAIKPQVILRFICWLSSLIVWACISTNGWQRVDKRDVCLFNGDNAACRFGSGIGFIGFIASMAFLGIEAMFQNMSSIKMRRRIVLADVGFSGIWAALFLIAFGYLSITWGKADYPPLGKGINNCRAAIVFSLFSIGSWAACSYLAYLRWQEGADMTQFSSGFQPEDFNQMGIQPTMAASGGGDMSTGAYNTTGGENYSAYTGASEMDPNYQSNPFTAMASQETMPSNYQTPSY